MVNKGRETIQISQQWSTERLGLMKGKDRKTREDAEEERTYSLKYQTIPEVEKHGSNDDGTAGFCNSPMYQDSPEILR